MDCVRVDGVRNVTTGALDFRHARETEEGMRSARSRIFVTSCDRAGYDLSLEGDKR